MRVRESSSKPDSSQVPWTPIDAVKSRMFVQLDDSTGGTLLGHLSGITKVANYVLNDLHDVEHYERIRGLSDMILNRDKRLLDLIYDERIPIGLPHAFGGINHPVGLRPGYIRTLSEDQMRNVETILSMDIADLYSFTYQAEDGVPDHLVRQGVKQLLEWLEENQNLLPFDTVKEQTAEFAREKDWNWFSGNMKDTSKVAKKNLGLTTLNDVVKGVISGLNFRASLQGASPATVVGGHTRIKRKIRKIRSLPQVSTAGGCVGFRCWNMSERDLILYQRELGNSYWLKRDELNPYLDDQKFPTLRVDWR